MIKQRKVDLPQKKCKEADCKRCTQGCGGWQFRWVDKRWTPRSALRTDRTPDVVYKLVEKAWPEGVRVAKAPLEELHDNYDRRGCPDIKASDVS